MDDLTPQERALVDAAVARGLLSRSDLDAAREQAAFQGGRVFDHVRARMRRAPAPPPAAGGLESSAASAVFNASPPPGFASAPGSMFGASPASGSGSAPASGSFPAAGPPSAREPGPSSASVTRVDRRSCGEAAGACAASPEGGERAVPRSGTLDPGPARAAHASRGDDRTFAAPSEPRVEGSAEPALWRSSTGEGGREGWVGDYRIVRELARGGMGVVYVARSAHLDRDVALKMLLPRTAGPDAVERFRIEARAAARLRHPNIVGLHQVGEDAGRPYMVMDLIPGGSLKDRVDQKGPLPEREAARLAVRLADALGYAHQRAILHRDVKPHNVLLDAAGEPILTDFGLAKDVAVVKEGVTVSGQTMGTPAYMPPEQAGGDLQALDRRADIYALGATLYHLLVGRAPFDGTPVQVITAVLTRDPVRPGALRRGLDPDLETICLTCLEKEPERRYRTMRDLQADLEAFLDDRPIQARAPGLADRLGKWRRRNPTLARVLLGSGLLLGGGATLGAVLLVDARTEAVRREADAAGRERAALVRQARERAAEAMTARRPGRPGAEGLANRTARALEAYVAAQRWHGLAPADPEAAKGLHAAACAMGEVNVAAGQWLLAAQAYDEAARLGVDDAAARASAEEARAAWQAERAAAERDLAARRRTIEEQLAAAAEGKLQAQRAAFEQGVYRVVRAARADTLPLLLERLDRVAATLERAEREAFVAALEQGGASAAQRRDVEEAVRRRADAKLTRTQQHDDIERWGAAAPHVARWFEARGLTRGTQAMPLAMVLGIVQTDALGGEAQVARLVVAALAQLGDDPRVPPALMRYLARENDLERATRAAVALCLMGGVAEAEAVRYAGARFGEGSPFLREVAPLMGQVAGLLEAQDDSLSGAVRQAQILTERGDHAGVLRVIDEALARHPDAPPEYRMNRVVALKLMGDHEGAAAECSGLLERLPGHAPALRERALARRQLKDIAGARADLDELLRRSPADSEAWLLLAAVRFDARDAPGAEEAFGRCLALDPQNAEAFANRGAIRMVRGDLAGARTDVDAALRFSPQNVQALTLAGDIADRGGDRDAAIAAYTRAIDLVPDRAHPWARRAAVRLEAGDGEGARQDARRALAIDPRQAEATRVLARLADPSAPQRGWPRGPVEGDPLQEEYERHRAAGDLRAALAVLQRIVAARPADEEALLRLAELAADLGERALVQDATRRLEASADPARRVAAHLVRARLNVKTGRLDEAARDADQARALAPGSGAAWEVTGLVRHFKKDLDGAVEAYTKAIALDPRRAGYVYNRGATYIEGHHAGRAGWAALARTDMERAIELDPNEVGAWGNLGILRAEAGDVDGAISALERAIALAPDHPMTARTRDLVRQLRARAR